MCYRNLNVTNLNVPDLMALTLEFYELTEPETLVYNIEHYKIMPREFLIDYINANVDNPEKYVISADVYNPNVLSDELKGIENKFNILIRVISARRIQVLMNMFSDIDEDTLITYLSDYKVDIKYITPKNFEELQFPHLRKGYHYDILLRRIVYEAIRLKCTDIHFDVRHITKKPDYIVRFRIGNTMVDYDDFEFTRSDFDSLIKTLVEKKTRQNSSDIDVTGTSGLISDVFKNGDIDLRITSIGCYKGTHSVIRIQKLSTTTFTIDGLGFDESTTNDLKRVIKRARGLIALTGPVRTGKNTTAFALAKEIHNSGKEVIEYSAPIETLMPFSQVDYHDDVDYLLDCIRMIKKQDKNMVFLGEIPDKRVAFSVRDLVNSSIGVLTTFHIDRIWHLPHKLYEFYGDSYKDVLTQITAIFNQKMFVRQCKECGKYTLIEEIRKEDEDAKIYLRKYGVSNIYLNDSDSCKFCKDGELLGQLRPFCESLVLTDEIRDELLRFDKPYEMERFIKKYMTDNKLSLDFKVTDAISKGIIPYKSVYQLI